MNGDECCQECGNNFSEVRRQLATKDAEIDQSAIETRNQWLRAENAETSLAALKASIAEKAQRAELEINGLMLGRFAEYSFRGELIAPILVRIFGEKE